MLIKAGPEWSSHSVTIILRLEPSMRQSSLQTKFTYFPLQQRSLGELPQSLQDWLPMSGYPIASHLQQRRQAGNSVTTLFSFRTHLKLMLYRPFLKDHGVLLSTPEFKSEQIKWQPSDAEQVCFQGHLEFQGLEFNHFGDAAAKQAMFF